MAEIHINKNDIKSIVDTYKKENSTFVVRNFYGDDRKKTCYCYINGKECKIDFHIKNNCVNILPTGNNVNESNLLINYIASKGFSTKIPAKQFVFPCTRAVVDSLIEYIEKECIGLVTCVPTKNDNIYKFRGYNGDELTFTFYPQTNKAMIQSRPYHAYSIVVSFLSGLSDFSFDQIVNMNNAFAEMNTSSSSIRNNMQAKLGDAYLYLDEALLKSISGSLSLLNQKNNIEDYTGCVTGEFKALEGYLKKILSQKYSYRLEKNNTFSMFFKDKGQPSKIECDTQIHKDAKDALNRVYYIYSNKRNIYLHTTIDPSQTRIIETLKEAQELSDEILQTINETYQIIFK
jgi:hypothetical protein